MAVQNRANLNPMLTWLWELLSIYSTEELFVPTDFTSRVQEIQLLLQSDTSGLVNSILDFAISSAAVDFTIETDDENFTKLITKWLESINRGLIGRVPTGIRSLSKEYFRERWKNSSFIVLRTVWEDVPVDNVTLNLPTKMWFVDGLNLEVKDDNATRVIGEEKYFIKTSGEPLQLPAKENELIFIQKPYSSWGSLYTTPFLIQRGLYKNLKIYDLINKKSEKIIAKALEYLLILRKGSEVLAQKGIPEFIYSDKDFEDIKTKFTKIIQDSRVNPGTPLHTTNFDTEFEHLIPEYSKILSDSLYTNIQKRLLAGLGLVEIVEGVASTRREAILNPRPFMTEVENGIKDFISMMTDVSYTISQRNKGKHPKYFGEKLQFHYTPLKEFLTDGIRDHLRSMYDRGLLSKQTYTEVVGGVDFDIEVTRRKQETKADLNKTMYPPIVQNTEQYINDPDGKLKALTPPTPSKPFAQQKVPQEKIPTKKIGPEAKNFKGELEEPYDGTDTEFVEALSEFSHVYEEAPYKKNADLPPAVKKHSTGAQKAFREAFNSALEQYKDEQVAFKVAWSALSKYEEKHSKGEVNE